MILRRNSLVMRPIMPLIGKLRRVKEHWYYEGLMECDWDNMTQKDFRTNNKVKKPPK